MKTIDVTFNELLGLSYQWGTIVDLYAACLVTDDSWHFFHEGPELIHIRCSDRFIDDVVDFLTGHSTVVSVTEPREWVDAQPIVEMHKWYFTKQFHNNSMLAIELYEQDGYPPYDKFFALYDRVSHCLMNSWTFIGVNAAKSRTLTPLELAIVTEYAAKRAMFIGKYLYYLELNDAHIKRASEEGTNGSDS